MRPVESERSPHLPIAFTVDESRHAAEALLDTGFDGDLAVPPEIASAFPARRRRLLAGRRGAICLRTQGEAIAVPGTRRAETATGR